jgi:hypothetical protein
MDDFTQFDAFERCREFARLIAVHLQNGSLLRIQCCGLIRYLNDSDIRGRKFKNRDSDHLAPKSRKPPPLTPNAKR